MTLINTEAGAPATGNGIAAAAAAASKNDHAQQGQQTTHQQTANDYATQQPTNGGINGGTGGGNGPIDYTTLDDIFGNLSAAATVLSEEGTEYRDTLVECCATPSKFQIEATPCETIDLPKHGSMVIHRDNLAVVVIFQEIARHSTSLRVKSRDNTSMTGEYTEFTLPTDQVHFECMKDLKDLRPDLRPVAHVVVTTSDYKRAVHLFSYIHRFLFSFTSKASFNFENLRYSAPNRDYDIVFSANANVQAVQAELDRYSPHGVRARCDIGCVIEAMQYPRHDGFQVPANRIPIAVVSAYTDFIVDANGGMMAQQQMNMPMNMGGMSQRFIYPLVHISEVVTPTNVLAFLPIAFVVSSNVFAQTWSMPYLTPSPDSPNLGNLTFDQQNKMQKCDNAAEVNAFIGMNVGIPLMAIDVVSGRATPPSLELIASQGNEATRLYYACLGIVGMDESESFSMARIREHVGVYKDLAGNLVDSRHCDYLSCVASGHKAEDVLALRERHADPTVRENIVRSIHQDYEAIYTNTICIINGKVMETLQKRVLDVISLRTNTTVNNGNIMLSNVSDMASRMANMYGGYSTGGNYGGPQSMGNYNNPYTTGVYGNMYR